MSEPARTGRRGKWEAFWERPRIEARATHRSSALLVLELLRREGAAFERPRVLDLGCGAGQVMELLEAAGCRVVGVDLAARALLAARQRLGSAAHLVQGDAFRLGLASQSFDVVVSLGYASVGAYPGVQAELGRVLRPGGLALVDFRRVGLYHLPMLPWWGRGLARGWRRGEVSFPLLGLRPARTWTAAGFRLEAVRLFNTFPPLGARFSQEACLAFERRARRVAPLLARTALAKFRRVDRR